ncbi:MAG: NAD-dependent epimerase/dehydratase family protein [Candidatus Krumholzibacteria bacterium]|nr:NAD-dependent epimerase/dehydratase family protein [Candidatus Krumholzibacteria bacterium]
MGERLFLVTGASGFIGTVLCGRLRALGRVRALVRRRLVGPWDESVVADLAAGDLPAEALAGVDVAFHFAGKAHAFDEPGDAASGHRAVSVEGTRRLLEACRCARVARLVFASSVKAMGEGGEERLDESSVARPRSEYGRSKLDAEALVLRGGYVPHATVLRLPLVYGPGDRGNLARMIDAVDRGRFPPLPRVRNRRSMIHVDDVARAAVLAADHPAAAGRVFLLDDGRAYSTRQIYEWICASLGREVPGWTVPSFLLRSLARVGDVVGRARGRRWRFDSDAYDKLLGSAIYDGTAARDALGFEPEWDLQRALPRMVEGVRNRPRISSRDGREAT